MDESDKLTGSARLNCLSRTVRVGAADGPRPGKFRLSALLTGLSRS
jgi:hypothetical protein